MVDPASPDIPVIDMSDLSPSASELAQLAVSAELGRAARRVGFFYVHGHGIGPIEMAALFAASHRFFSLPQQAKESLSIGHSQANRGYVRLSAERLDPSSGVADCKEAFNVGLEMAPHDPELQQASMLRGLNQWPALPGWRESILTAYERLWHIGRLLHRGFALDLRLPADYFEPMLDRPLATLRLLRYPPLPPGQSPRLGAGAHTDYGNLTLLATDGVAGLQVRRRDGLWIDAPHLSGALVCNIGDCLMRWSNDVYVSTHHRVTAPTALRHSIAFFLDPNPDALVECLPTCIEPGGKPKYPPITAAEYLRSRLDATYRPAPEDKRTREAR